MLFGPSLWWSEAVVITNVTHRRHHQQHHLVSVRESLLTKPQLVILEKETTEHRRQKPSTEDKRSAINAFHIWPFSSIHSFHPLLAKSPQTSVRLLTLTRPHRPWWDRVLHCSTNAGKPSHFTHSEWVFSHLAKGGCCYLKKRSCVEICRIWGKVSMFC